MGHLTRRMTPHCIVSFGKRCGEAWQKDICLTIRHGGYPHWRQIWRTQQCQNWGRSAVRQQLADVIRVKKGPLSKMGSNLSECRYMALKIEIISQHKWLESVSCPTDSHKIVSSAQVVLCHQSTMRHPQDCLSFFSEKPLGVRLSSSMWHRTGCAFSSVSQWTAVQHSSVTPFCPALLQPF